uniref:Uncharacterized protein n=1 Tax=Oryza nivara TaxID=4536 RepID=A0A0E0HI23_ORYNI
MKWTQYSSRTGSSPRKKFGKAYHLELKNLGLQEALQGRTFEKELVVSQLLYRLIGIFSMRRIDGAGAISSHSQDVSVPLALMATYKSGVFPSSYEILFPEQQEEACKMVEIALHAYAKQKDMPVDFLNCKEEKDVYLCCPLEENDNGYCFGCRVQHIKLRRPTSADYLGGHKDICSEYIDVEYCFDDY